MKKARSALALLLCLVMCLSLFPASAFADSEIAEELALAGDNAFAPNEEFVGDGGLDVPEDDALVGDGALDVSSDNDKPSVADGDNSPCAGEPEDLASPAGGGAEQSEAEGLTPPQSAEADSSPEGGADENDASAGDGILDVLEAEPVRVVFEGLPEGAVIELYAGAEKQPDEEPIEPEADGSYLLPPGEYRFCVSCEGYAAVEEEKLTVEASGEPLRFELRLAPAEEPAAAAIPDIGGDSLNALPASDGIQSVVASGSLLYDLSWSLDDRGRLTISGNGVMTSFFNYSSPPWYSYRSSIKSVVISSGVENISNFAFYGCSNLASITIPNSVTRIDDYAFERCSGLTSITIPKSVTSIGLAFRFSGLTSITVDAANSTYSSVDGVLFNKAKTELICFPGGRSGSYTVPAGVTSIGNSAFYGCSGLMDIAVPASVTSIGESAFGICNGLTGVTIEEGLTSIGGGAFYSCFNLTSITLPDSLTTIGAGLFNGCGRLTSVKLPAGLTAISGHMFWGCSGLTSFEIPEGVTSIGICAFSNCYNLTSITIPASVTSIGETAFSACNSLTGITIPEGVTSIGETAFSECSNLTSITLPASLTSIGENAFQYCSSLSEVFFAGSERQRDKREGDGWSTYGNEKLFDAVWHYTAQPLTVDVYSFAELKAAVQACGDGELSVCCRESGIFEIEETITLPDGLSFFADEENSTLLIPAGVTLTVESSVINSFRAVNLVVEGTMVAYRRAVRYRTLSGAPDWILCVVASGTTGAQGDNLSWTVYDHGELLISGSGAMADGAVPWNDYRRTIEIITVADGVTKIGESSFSVCSDLTAVTLPAGLTSIGRYAFSGSGLQSIVLPAGLTRIEEGVFSGCTRLTDVGLPAGLTRIGEGAFSGCTGLTQIELPAGLTRIDRYAFFNCSGLTDVSYGGSERQRIAREGADWSAVENEALFNAAWHYAVLPENVTVHDFAGLKAAVQDSNGSEICIFYSGSEPFVIEETITLPENIFFCADAEGATVRIPSGVTLTVESSLPDAFSVENLVVEGSMIAYRRAVCCGTLSGTVDWLRRIVTSGSCGAPGHNVSWALYEDGELLISGSGAMEDYTSSLSPWYDYRGSITSVVVESGVMSIGVYAFVNCSSLTGIEIPASVTIIGIAAFSDCSSLSDVAFGGSARQRSDREGSYWSTSGNEDLFDAAWYYAVQPSETDVHNFAELKAAVQAFDGGELYVFYNGSQTFVIEESITLPEGFYFCADADNSSLRVPAGVTLTVSSTVTNAFYTENLTVEGTMRAYRRAVWYRTLSGTVDWLRMIAMSGYCGTQGGNVAWTLYEDGELLISGSGDMADFAYDPGISYAPWTPYGSIQRVTVEPGVTSIGKAAFYNCNLLTSVSLPTGLRSIGIAAFSNCTALTSVTFPASLTVIGDMAFENCRGLTSVTFPAGLTSIGSNAFCWCSMTSVVLREGLTSIGNYAFDRCRDLRSIMLPQSLTAIGWGAFRDCGKLTDVYFGGTQDQQIARRGNGWSTDSNDPLYTASWRFNYHAPGWYESGGKWYYYGENSQMMTDWQRIGGKWYYFRGNGVMQTGWVKYDNKWYYFDNSGVMQTGWKQLGGKWYYLDSSGAMQTGWKQIGGKWYYFDSAGVMQTGLQAIGGTSYYFDDSGVMQTGWKQLDGAWHYFNSSGAMLTGLQTIGGKTYFFDSSGAMQTGWIKVSGKWYYADSDGVVQTGFLTINGKTYYFDDGGAMQTGWKQLGGKWYCFNSSGVMQTGFRTIDGTTYYFDDSGVMQTGWKQLGGAWYCFGSSGAMQTGWLQSGSSWYYFDADGKMQTGFRTIGGSTYCFASSGAMKTGWQQLDGAWYYFGSSGAMQTGWLQSGSSWYYFDAEGKMLTGLQTIGGKIYYFASSGAMKTGWQQLGESWYYFQSDGAAKTGWFQSGSFWYYFGADGKMATGLQTIGGKIYYFTSSGAMKTGWQQVGESWYYFQSGGAAKTGWLKSGSKWYYFDADGAMLANTSRRIGSKTYYFNASGVCTNP